MSVKTIFQRVEKKYLLDSDTYLELLKCIKPYMSMDHYGIHTICNIYYDTESYEIIRNSIEGPKYKEKLRLRSYGVPKDTDTVFLELKKKFDGIVYKRRIPLTLRQADNYLNHGIKPVEHNQILQEMDYFIHRYQPAGRLFLAYDRTAYYSKEDASVRITFDHNIRSRDYDLDLKCGDYGETCLDSGYLMEIKVSYAIPLWLVHILSDLCIYPTSFSKYGTIYTQKMNENRRNEKCLQVY